MAINAAGVQPPRGHGRPADLPRVPGQRQPKDGTGGQDGARHLLSPVHGAPVQGVVTISADQYSISGTVAR